MKANIKISKKLDDGSLLEINIDIDTPKELQNIATIIKAAIEAKPDV